MEGLIKRLQWKKELESFSHRNQRRPTRLEVMGPSKGPEADYWLEDGLLLEGIDLDADEGRDVSLEVMLEGQTGKTRNHMTHNVAGVKSVKVETCDGRDESLEIEDTEGAVTILRFELMETRYH